MNNISLVTIVAAVIIAAIVIFGIYLYLKTAKNKKNTDAAQKFLDELKDALFATAENIVALADKREVETLTDLEISFGNEENEGYVVFAAPASMAGSVTFINRNNTFTQVPLKEGTVNISGTEYKYFIFEYSYELIPFKLR